MAFQDIVLDYANKAQVKIAELTTVIQEQLALGNESPKELASAIELLNFQEALLDTLNGWSEEVTLYWIEYFKIKYELTDIVYTECEMYVMPTVVSGGAYDSIYATIASLESLRTSTTNYDLYLLGLIEALQDFDYSGLIPQQLLDDVAALKTKTELHDDQIDEITTDLQELSDDFSDHENNTTVHITGPERASWNLRVTLAQLATAIENLSVNGHTHNISSITGLQAILNDLQTQIDELPIPEDGDPGATPTLSIGTVTEGPSFAVELDGSSTLLNPVLNFTLVKGNDGADFHIDDYGTLLERDEHDEADPGYAYLDEENGNLYFLISTGVWSDPIPFKGWNGWTPRLGLYVFNSSTVLLEILGFFGGTGPVPELVAPVGDPSPRFFLTAYGYTTIPENAINIKGNEGSQTEIPFIIDEEGTDRTIYNTFAKGFTFLDTTTGKVSFKNSDDDGDWSTEYQWTGPIGPPGDTLVSNITVVLEPGEKIGPYSNGDVIPSAGKTPEQVFNLLARKYLKPLWTSFALPIGPTVEVGTTLTTPVTATWVINVRSGTVSTIDIIDVTGSSTIVAGTANDGSQSIALGVIQLNSNGASRAYKGTLHDTGAIPSDIDSATYTITSRYYRWWAPVSSTPTTSAHVRALAGQAFQTAGNVFTLVTGTSLLEWSVCLPPGVTIVSVIDTTNLGANLTSNYVLIGTINVTDAGGTTRAYNQYKYVTATPYPVSANHVITTT